MNRPFLRRIVAGTCLLLLGSSSVAQSISSAHWKATSSIEGSAEKDSPTDFECWMKGEKRRLKIISEGRKANILVLGETLYTWEEGQTMGMKLSVAPSEESDSPHDYLSYLDEDRAKWKKLGSERVGGHLTDVYSHESSEGGQKLKKTVWLARGLSNFPVKYVEEEGGEKTTTMNREIRVPASIPDSVFALPPSVRFMDVSEMTKGMR